MNTTGHTGLSAVENDLLELQRTDSLYNRENEALRKKGGCNLCTTNRKFAYQCNTNVHGGKRKEGSEEKFIKGRKQRGLAVSLCFFSSVGAHIYEKEKRKHQHQKERMHQFNDTWSVVTTVRPKGSRWLFQ